MASAVVADGQLATPDGRAAKGLDHGLGHARVHIDERKGVIDADRADRGPRDAGFVRDGPDEIGRASCRERVLVTV